MKFFIDSDENKKRNYFVKFSNLMSEKRFIQFFLACKFYKNQNKKKILHQNKK